MLMSNRQDQHQVTSVNGPILDRGSRRQELKKLQQVICLLPLCVLAATGCKVARQTASLPGHVVTAVVPGDKSTQPDPAALQSELLRYADDFSGRTTTGLEEYARRVNTPKAREDALNWRLALVSSALGIATGDNPMANLIDFLALSTLTRAFLERQATNAEPPGAFDVWLENCRVLETNAWNIAAHFLTKDQQQEMRTNISRWLELDAKQGTGFLRRPQALASEIRQAGEKESKPGSVFSLVGLDPTAGLDPAIREVTRTRLFAERALYAMERMPLLVRWQTDVLTGQLLRQEQLTNALASADRLSRAAESATQIAAELPDRITAERKAVLAALESQAGNLRSLSADVSQSLTAGEKMSTSLNTTLITFDALMKRFGVGEPDTSPPNTNSPPFNILDYARTADQIGIMAQRLDVLIKDVSGTVDTPALDKRIAQLNALSGKARADAKSALNHAFVLAAGLIVLSFICALIYRRFAPSPRLATAGQGLAGKERPL
jgi:hypothetical protein